MPSKAPSAYSSPTQHQAFQNFPKLDSPVVNIGGTLSIPWYRALITLWQKSGPNLPTPTAAVVQSSGEGTAVYTATGQLVGYIPIQPTTSAITSVTMVVNMVAPPDFYGDASIINAASALQHPPDQLNVAGVANLVGSVMPILKGP